MKKKLNCVLLIDDEDDCNFFHQRLFKKMGFVETVEVAEDGIVAINFLKSKKNTPSIIFLDINMPKMDGWEFLEEYEKLDDTAKSSTVLIMLTSSLNPDDRIKAESLPSVKGFNMKYLDEAQVEEILRKHFPFLFEI